MSWGAIVLSGVEGYRAAIDRAAAAGERIARGARENDLPSDLVMLRESRVTASAAIAVIRTADEVLGSLLDVKR